MSQIGGEATGLLKDVITSQVVGLKERYGDHGPQGLLPSDILLDKRR